MECGHLEKGSSPDGSRTGFDGEIRLHGVPFTDIALRQCADKRSDKSPDYDIHARGPSGWYLTGKAWVKEMKAGGDMLSLTIDGPTMAKPVYVSAFPDEDGKQPKDAKTPVNYSIKWSRPRAGSAPVVQAAAPLNDAVPY